MFAKTLLHSLVDCQNTSVELLVWLSENMDSLLKGGELIIGFVQTGLTLNMDKLDTEYQWKLWAFLQNGTEWKLIAEMSDVPTFIFLPNVFSENFGVLQDWPSNNLERGRANMLPCCRTGVCMTMSRADWKWRRALLQGYSDWKSWVCCRTSDVFSSLNSSRLLKLLSFNFGGWRCTAGRANLHLHTRQRHELPHASRTGHISVCWFTFGAILDILDYWYVHVGADDGTCTSWNDQIRCCPKTTKDKSRLCELRSWFWRVHHVRGRNKALAMHRYDAIALLDCWSTSVWNRKTNEKTGSWEVEVEQENYRSGQ